MNRRDLNSYPIHVYLVSRSQTLRYARIIVGGDEAGSEREDVGSEDSGQVSVSQARILAGPIKLKQNLLHVLCHMTFSSST